MRSLCIRPMDPLVFGTGRPFSQIPGSRIESEILPAPSTLAGMVRAEAGRGHDGKFDVGRIDELLECSVRGPLLAYEHPDGEGDGAARGLAFPAPADCVRLLSDTLPDDPPKTRFHDVVRLVPLKLEETDLVSEPTGAPVGMCTPALGKPAGDAPGFWTEAVLKKWLVAPVTAGRWPASAGVTGPGTEVRTHVRVDKNNTAMDGALFSSAGRRFEGRANNIPCALAVYAETDAPVTPGGFVVLGGEGRLSSVGDGAPFRTHDGLLASPPAEVLASARVGAIRAYFATPAHFGGSDWSPPSPAEVVAACHHRAWVISGWEMTPRGSGPVARDYPSSRFNKPRGGRPKAIRRLVPAGAVYFLRLTGDPEENVAFVQKHWNRTVHEGQDGRDGFGVVLFGTWDGQFSSIHEPNDGVTA